MFMVKDNLSGESLGGSLMGSDTGTMQENCNRVSTLRRQPLLQQGKGDLQAQEERNGGLFSIDSEEDKPSGGHRVASMPIPIAAAAASADGHAKPRSKSARKEKVLKVGPDGNWKLVQMTEEHVDEVIRIQQACYEPEYREERQSYVDRIRVYPEGNIVLMVPDPTATAESPSTPPSPTSPPSSKKRKTSLKYTMAGYILAQPFYRGAINDVNDVKAFSKWIEDRADLPRTEGDCIYIHELSVHPDFRGQGLALPLTDYSETLARGANFKWLTLVALGSALGFWKRTGYILEQEIVYGGHTCFYMEKPSGLEGFSG